ncbi:MAG: carbohydrate ABC transporter permease [Lachnospiraceae bacterium]|jgi:multiple sugar transport system permease protein|nr:carbohydrate ABC transporter permease [Lachnospiraceae bacterium]
MDAVGGIREVGMRRGRKRMVSIFLRYFLLIGIGVVFLYPILYMISNSFKSVQDLVNPTVEWLPAKLYPDNFLRALKTLDYWKTLPFTVLYTTAATLAQTISCAMAGYAFARHEFPLKRFWMVMLIAAFLIPAQVTLVPRYLMFYNYGLTNTPFAVWLPSLLGQGVSSSIFVLIFENFFGSYPKSFDEAAKLDGAGKFTIFFRVALPVVKPAVVVSVLFSFVWFWNETYTSGQLMGSALRTLPMKLESFVAEFSSIYSTGDMTARLNESARMAATLLVIAPLGVLYVVLQRSFIRGIDAASGITGE